MITKENLKETLLFLGFTAQSERDNATKFIKNYPNQSSDTYIEVDFKNETIKYNPVDNRFGSFEIAGSIKFPKLGNPSSGFIIHRKTTCNFSANENFVCLVCIDALLEKGYKPEHILLEPAFELGHINKPSYGDILVYSQDYSPLVLIENKTYGSEFSKEWNNMQKYGGQLFSYLKGIENCQNVCLYSCDFEDSKIIYKSNIIELKDNDKYLDTLNLKDDDKKSYKTAKTQETYFEIWDKIYQKAFITQGIFEKSVEAYSVGKDKYTIKDLKVVPYTEIQNIYYEFATILRNNAIGNYENTFYILVDLFLCKITDELHNKDDLQFNYKGVMRDNPIDYCERLLNLYEKGKDEYFKVKVINYKSTIIDEKFNEFKRYKNSFKNELERIFKEQKFYSIKKFNFINVENREEFEQNFKVLIQITNLFQDFYITQSENNQFLGDLFEGFLNRSVHQTEGRFFTPTPITNFIISSFPPLKKPKVLDFACGAGHFLTQYLEINDTAEIYGIELNKDLSGVAKIAVILHSKNKNNSSHILFQNTLKPLLKSKFDDGRDNDELSEYFDLIISNPPYSVKGFLNNLDEKERNRFELQVDEKSIEKNNAIECFFIERSLQLLKNDGYFALVLPISVLSKNGIYEKTREILFKNFNILSIVELNKRTFGSTGTLTVIIFAQKVKKNTANIVDFLKNNSFNDDKLKKEFINTDFLKRYCDYSDLPYDDYKIFMNSNEPSDILRASENFKNYFEDYSQKSPKIFKKGKEKDAPKDDFFKKSTFYSIDYEPLSHSGVLNKKQLKAENAKRKKERKNAYDSFLKSEDYKSLLEQWQYLKFYDTIREIECEKLTYFLASYENELILLKSPPEKIKPENAKEKSNKDEIIKFLGYDWSKRKGDEGIKYQTLEQNPDAPKDDDDDNDEIKKEKESLENINSVKFIQTPLYNPSDFNDRSKLNYIIKAFIGKELNESDFANLLSSVAPENANSYSITKTKLNEMINFKKLNFDKEILLKPELTELFGQNDFDKVKIGSLISERKKSSVQVNENKEKQSGKYPFFTSGNEIYKSNDYLCDGETIFISTGGKAYVKYCKGKASYSTDTYAITCENNNLMKTKFLYYICKINSFLIESYLFKGQGLKHLQKDEFKNLKIPCPSLDIQEKFVTKYEAVEKNEQKIIDEISNLKKQMLKKYSVLDEMGQNNGKSLRLSNSDIFDISIGKRILNSQMSNEYKIPVYSANVKEPFGKINDLLIKDFSIPSVLWGIDGDWMVNFIPSDIEFYPTDHCGVLRVKGDEVSPKYLAYLLEIEGKKVNFSRSLRASIERIASISIVVPPKPEQDKIIMEIEKIENKIVKLEAKLKNLSFKKEQILKKYFQ